jgi:MoxR-like ATPase
MDAHPGIMVFATNLVHNLDPAVLRRFTFKMEFGYLTREGRRQFFQKAFRTPLTPADAMRLDGMDRLTPGDFRTVSQGLRLAGDHADNKTRLDALAQEIARKPATEAWRLTAQSRSVIGFR